MKNIENEYKKYIDSNIEVPSIKDRVKSRIDFKKKEGSVFMSKKWIIGLSVAATVAIVVGVGAGVYFNRETPSSNKEVRALVNVDVNPSVEFSVDTDNKVVSVKGLNDEGEMIIYGEAMVGKTIDEALDILVKVETKTGYLEANGTASENKISMSVSCDSDYVNTLKNKVEASLTEACAKYDVSSTIEKVNKYTHEELEKIALKCDPTLTSDEVKEMSYKELSKIISIYQIETSGIVTSKIEDLYVEVRDNEISFSETKPVQDAISKADGLVKAALSAFNSLYTTALDSLKESYDALEETRYTLFVDSNSDYQKALKSVNDAKDDVLKYRNQINSVDHNNEELYNSLIASLDTADLILDNANKALLNYEELGNNALDLAKSTIDTVMTTLQEVSKQVENVLSQFDSNYFNDKVVALEKAINEAKDEAFTNFENKYKDDIENAKKELKDRKAKLIEQIKNA